MDRLVANDVGGGQFAPVVGLQGGTGGFVSGGGMTSGGGQLAFVVGLQGGGTSLQTLLA